MEVPLLALRFGISRVLDCGKAHFILLLYRLKRYYYENFKIFINVATVLVDTRAAKLLGAMVERLITESAL